MITARLKLLQETNGKVQLILQKLRPEKNGRKNVAHIITTIARDKEKSMENGNISHNHGKIMVSTRNK